METLYDYVYIHQDLDPQSLVADTPTSGVGYDFDGWNKALFVVNAGVINGTSLDAKVVASGDGASSWTNVTSASGSFTDAEEAYLIDVDFGRATISGGSIKAVLTAVGDTALGGVTVVFYRANGSIPGAQENTVIKNH